MSSFVSSRLLSAVAVLGVLFAASAARAQFEECVIPASVPESVFDTIVDQAGFGFGTLSGKVCKGIANKGASTCRTQVKLQEKCFRKAIDTNYQIAVKECNQLGTKQDRKECKSDAKSLRNENRDDVKNSEKSGLDTCKDELKSALTDVCENGVN